MVLQKSAVPRTEEWSLLCAADRGECCAANRGEERSLLCAANKGEESAVLRTDSVAAPNRNLVNLAVLVENRSVFDENWGVLDENSAPAGLPAWPAFRPNIIPK